MKNNKHETLREKFWDWWEYADIGDIIKGFMKCLLAVMFVLFLVWLTIQMINSLRPADELPAEEPAEGVGRDPAVVRFLSAPEADEIGTAYALDEYTEGESPVPAWWDPEEEMAIVWTDDGSGDRNDAGCPDWNLDTTLHGWDGHGAEVWEMDLFARIFYLEFWQPDMMLCEAGCDAILRLWESGEKGRTLGEVLSSRNEDGSWTYSVYPDVWTTDYDAEGLAWCRAYCEERFYSGPEWVAPYFRLDYYHDWAVPAYQIGNVYFSVGR